MPASWFWVWLRGDPQSHARRRKAESLEQAACRQLEVMAVPGSDTWTFCVQRCGTTTVHVVEVQQTVLRTAKAVGMAGEEVDRG